MFSVMFSLLLPSPLPKLSQNNKNFSLNNFSLGSFSCLTKNIKLIKDAGTSTLPVSRVCFAVVFAFSFHFLSTLVTIGSLTAHSARL
jgi:hypothetical protein